MANDRLEEVCKQLRLSHIPRVIETADFETKEDWLLFLLENELKCREELKTARKFGCIQILFGDDFKYVSPDQPGIAVP